MFDRCFDFYNSASNGYYDVMSVDQLVRDTGWNNKRKELYPFLSLQCEVLKKLDEMKQIEALSPLS